LCPVGALTSMPYSFTSRAWELLYIRSIDILDSLCSSIRIDVNNNKVQRILPSLDGLINNEWITNKIRFSYDSLNIQRLNYPKIAINKKFIIIGWHFAVYLYLFKLYINRFNYIQAICGPFLDLNSSLFLKEFLNSFGCSNIIIMKIILYFLYLILGFIIY
jgi:NADH-quinone oxidoreductase subunit G